MPRSNPRATARETSHIPVASLPFRNAGVPPALLNRSPRWEPPASAGGAGLQSSEKCTPPQSGIQPRDFPAINSLHGTIPAHPRRSNYRPLLRPIPPRNRRSHRRRPRHHPHPLYHRASRRRIGRLLTYLSRGLHADVALLTLTRGQGGQNALGPEQGAELGVIRTQELLAADKHYGVHKFFTRAKDTGYSKTPEQARKIWGGVALEDMVRVIRTFRPNIVINGWGGVHAGHGHHQESGILTPQAIAAAADPKMFPEQIAEGLPAWKVTLDLRPARDPNSPAPCRFPSTTSRRSGAKATSTWAWKATRSTARKGRRHSSAIRFSAARSIWCAKTKKAIPPVALIQNFSQSR